MAVPVLRELGVGHTIWQLIIGRDQFNAASGLVYPDGMVRRIAQIEAVMNASAVGFEEKPDEQGLPIRHDIPVLVAKYLEQSVRDGVTEVTWRERVTFVESLVGVSDALDREAKIVSESVAAARSAYDSGDRAGAFAIVAGLIEKAASLTRAHPPQPAPPSVLKAYVYRDVFGVPHIFADSEEAAAYAMAQAQCEDIGMQVFYSLRCGVARQAEVLGEASLESDRLMHLWRVPETAARTWRESPPRTKRFLQAFCDGLNDYRRTHLDECRDALEADPVQVIALFRWSDVSPSHGIVQLCANTGLRQPPPPVDYPNQSSTWTIGPSPPLRVGRSSLSIRIGRRKARLPGGNSMCTRDVSRPVDSRCPACRLWDSAIPTAWPGPLPPAAPTRPTCLRLRRIRRTPTSTGTTVNGAAWKFVTW